MLMNGYLYFSPFKLFLTFKKLYIFQLKFLLDGNLTERDGVRFELDGTGRSAVQVFLRGTVPDSYFPSRVTLYCSLHCE